MSSPNHLSDDSSDVDEALQQIENKYSMTSPTGCSSNKSQTAPHFLNDLLQEFDTLGLPAINLRQPVIEVLQQITNNTHLLIQLHRQTISQLKDVNIKNSQRDTKNFELEKKISELTLILKQHRNKYGVLENKNSKLVHECSELRANIANHKEETDKIKTYHRAKVNELVLQIKNLRNENDHLKELCGKTAGQYFSKDDKITKILGEYRRNEETYKSTIQKLQENNEEIFNEVLNLKEELATAYSKDNK